MDPIEPPIAPTEPRRLGGISRGLATIGLAVGLLAVGGAAAVMAASPEPSASGTPSTQPSATDDASTTSTDRPNREDCPEGSDGAGRQNGDRGGGDASPPTETPTSTDDSEV
jgi:hypothetical protein